MGSRLVRSARSYARLVALALTFTGTSALALSVTGCQDKKSLDYNLPHITDANPVERSKAIDLVYQLWRNVEAQ